MNRYRVARRLLCERAGFQLIAEGATEAQFNKVAKLLRKSGFSDERDVVRILYKLGQMDPSFRNPDELDMQSVQDAVANAKYTTWTFKRMAEYLKALASRRWLDSQPDPSQDQLDAANATIEANEILGDVMMRPKETVKGYRDVYHALSAAQSIPGFDVNRIGSLDELVTSVNVYHMQVYVEENLPPLPDLSESDIDTIADMGDPVTDEAFFIDSEQLAEYIDVKPYYETFGEEEGARQYAEATRPRYFAVMAASHAGCKTHGEDTQWCTRFGEEGEHTLDYLRDAPVFIIFCNESLQPPSGVDAGTDHGVEEYGIKKIAQAFWRRVPASRWDEMVMDVEDRTMGVEVLTEMLMKPFLIALEEASRDARADFTPLEDESTEDATETVTDLWGREYVFSRDDGLEDAEEWPFAAHPGGWDYPFRDLGVFTPLARWVDIIDLASLEHVDEVANPFDPEDVYYVADPDATEDVLLTEMLDSALNELVPYSDAFFENKDEPVDYVVGYMYPRSEGDGGFSIAQIEMESPATCFPLSYNLFKREASRLDGYGVVLPDDVDFELPADVERYVESMQYVRSPGLLQGSGVPVRVLRLTGYRGDYATSSDQIQKLVDHRAGQKIANLYHRVRGGEVVDRLNAVDAWIENVFKPGVAAANEVYPDFALTFPEPDDMHPKEVNYAEGFVKIPMRHPTGNIVMWRATEDSPDTFGNTVDSVRATVINQMENAKKAQKESKAETIERFAENIEHIAGWSARTLEEFRELYDTPSGGSAVADAIHHHSLNAPEVSLSTPEGAVRSLLVKLLGKSMASDRNKILEAVPGFYSGDFTIDNSALSEMSVNLLEEYRRAAYTLKMNLGWPFTAIPETAQELGAGE